ncbi:MAG: integration host factor subunit beta [Verrucomicrobiales bacterium]|jgi:nucleoid DNA-binding protein|nr:integration host factor subunit beta [Verrucomicrobiales bacterium]MDR1303755.1 integration host factor subunit beta [Verrucomicrobiales bacterium]
MANLTKRDLVVRISNEMGMVQQDVLNIVQKTLDYLTESLAMGKTVELRNFGVFEIKLREARVGRNPNRPESDVPIPPRAVVKFKAGKEMKAKVAALSAKMLADTKPATGSDNPPAV